uniref:Uncharacterized protein n=1 Tax=Nymphaea colorata TaxID=210225 RepID=A0A5K1GET3_9MAGN
MLMKKPTAEESVLRRPYLPPAAVVDEETNCSRVGIETPLPIVVRASAPTKKRERVCRSSNEQKNYPWKFNDTTQLNFRIFYRGCSPVETLEKSSLSFFLKT